MRIISSKLVLAFLSSTACALSQTLPSYPQLLDQINQLLQKEEASTPNFPLAVVVCRDANNQPSTALHFGVNHCTVVARPRDVMRPLRMDYVIQTFFTFSQNWGKDLTGRSMVDRLGASSVSSVTQEFSGNVLVDSSGTGQVDFPWYAATDVTSTTIRADLFSIFKDNWQPAVAVVLGRFGLRVKAAPLNLEAFQGLGQHIVQSINEQRSFKKWPAFVAVDVRLCSEATVCSAWTHLLLDVEREGQ